MCGTSYKDGGLIRMWYGGRLSCLVVCNSTLNQLPPIRAERHTKYGVRTTGTPGDGYQTLAYLPLLATRLLVLT